MYEKWAKISDQIVIKISKLCESLLVLLILFGENVIKIQSTYKCKQPPVFEQPHLGARIQGKTVWWRRWRR